MAVAAYDSVSGNPITEKKDAVTMTREEKDLVLAKLTYKRAGSYVHVVVAHGLAFKAEQETRRAFKLVNRRVPQNFGYIKNTLPQEYAKFLKVDGVIELAKEALSKEGVEMKVRKCGDGFRCTFEFK
jgi:hypothetical protein